MNFHDNGPKPEKMLTKLRLKFFAIIMIIISFVLGLIFLGTNITVKKIADVQYENFTQFLIERDGLKIATVAKQYSDSIKQYFLTIGDLNLFTIKNNVPFDASSMRNFFTVKFSHSGDIIETISLHPVNYSKEEIISMTEKIFRSDKEKGSFDGLQYQTDQKDYGYIAVFVDRKSDNNMHYLMDSVFSVLFCVSLGLSFILAYFLSAWALKPIRTAFVKQRQFVADTSHELKTPLAVINTNLDVLEYEIGENKWLEYVKSEAKRMNLLVKDLLYLAKYDSSEMIYDVLNFNLSRALTKASLPFESVAFDAGFTLEVQIEPDIEYCGDENRIKQLAVIFIDNAIKNTNEGGFIKVALKTQGYKKIFSVYNTGEGLDDAQKAKIFDRFYRADVSRARDTGGSGLGLSIAATIAHAHRSKIIVDGEKGGWIQFSIAL